MYHSKVRSYHGDINIHGIDGDIQAISDQGNCDILINYLKLDTTKPIIAAPLGSIKCHISPEVNLEIELFMYSLFLFLFLI